MADSGNLYAFIHNQALSGQPALSFLSDQFTDIYEWRESTQEYLQSLLLFLPEAIDLNPELVDHTEYDSYIQQKWYITSSPGERIPVILLLPRGITGRTPAILALHDHGGRYFFGKKKLISEENEPEILIEYRNELYDGAAIANELVQRGYIVAVIDSFYFGERRLDIPPPVEMQQEFLLAAEGSTQWLHLVDRVCASMEPTIAKSLCWAGTTWPGIMAWDDRRTIDFLLTIPEVDPARIGCIGFAMGGLRSALLSACDRRVKATCIAGWMS
ncbi:MAG TPA: alpha/beta hydrolase family protein, partial [Armatimonadota bacterium]|nr:alpha/beta hydrolase family protein [Armatimonadota bacterium]